MARTSTVTYWASRGGYGFCVRGTQHVVKGPRDAPHGPTYIAALKEHADRLALANADRAGDDNSLRICLEHYLADLAAGNTSPKYLALRQRQFSYLCDDAGLGELPVRQLKPLHIYQVTRLLQKAGMRRAGTHKQRQCARPWANDTLSNFLSGVRAALALARRHGLIDTNPLAQLDLPSTRSRGRETVLTDPQVQALMDACQRPAHHNFRDCLLVLKATGCRPGELCDATAAAFDQRLGTLTYFANVRRKRGEFGHKTGKKQKERVIYLTGEALEIVKVRAEVFPEGPLFRTNKGLAWTADRLGQRFRKLGKKLGIHSLTAYCFRHTFATRWLEAGQPVEHLAALLGNTVKVIHRHYAHLLANPLGLRSRLEAFMGAGAGTQSPPALHIAASS